MDATDLLYDHYKETMAFSKQAQHERDRFFIMLCLLIALLFIFGAEPDNTLSLLQSFVSTKFGAYISFSYNIIQSALWVMLLFYTIRYYQRNIYVERLYAYICKLEEDISARALCTFDRESKNYLKQYPFVLNLIHFSYTILFPTIYLIIVAYKIRLELLTTCSILNLLASCAIVSLTIFYLLFLHKK